MLQCNARAIFILQRPAKPKKWILNSYSFYVLPKKHALRDGESCFKKFVPNPYPLSPSPFSYMEAGFPQLPQCEQIAYQKPIHLQPEQVCLLRRAVLVMLAESLLYSFTCLRSIGVLMSISCSLHVSSTFL
jgi:hypothetical protein